MNLHFINESSSKMKASSLPTSQLDWLSVTTKPNYWYGSSSPLSLTSIPIDYDHLHIREIWEFRMQDSLVEERDARIKDNQDAPSKPNYSSDCSSSSAMSSKSIPIDYDRLQIQEDWEFRMQEILAEERDHSMFVRIVNGMIARQGSEYSSNNSCQSETDKSIASIMRTRYKKLDSEYSTVDLGSFAYDDQSNLIDNHNSDFLDQPPDAIFIIDM
jgi:hypothetical protein